MDKWTDVSAMLYSVRRSVLIIAAVLVGLSLVGGDLASAFGFAIGAALSLWQFSRLTKSVAKSLQMTKEAAQVYGASSYIVRYLIIAAALTIIYFTDGINFYAAFIGLLFVKIVIVSRALQKLLQTSGAAYLRQFRQKGGD